jgi:glutamate dehydrogenase
MYFTLGTRLHLHWLRDQILALPLGDRWHSLARGALRDNLYMLHSTLATEVLQGGPRELDLRGRIETWMTQNAVPLEHWLQLLSEMRIQEPYNLTMLSAAVHSLENLIHPRLYIESI